MLRRALLAGLVVLAALPSVSGAQGDSVVRVRGIAFDSVRNRPLAEAFVAVVGGSMHTQTDSRGRFHFDSAAPGVHTVVVQHPALDSLGFTGLSSRVSFAANGEVRIATPSFGTLWRRMCGDRPISEDSGFVYGVIRDAISNRPISEALVNVTWKDSLRRLAPSARNEAARDIENFEAARRKRKNDPVKPFDIPLRPINVNEHPLQNPLIALRLQGFSDSSGVYAICGVPRRGIDIRVSASADTIESEEVDASLDLRVHRRDLRLPVTTGGKPGVLAGQLVDKAGAGVPYARVTVAGAGESRTDDSGRFVLRGIEPGTRIIEVRFIGMAPVHTVVDLDPGDSVFTVIPLERVPMLGAMSVRAAGLGRVLMAEFSSRRQLGLGYFVDSTVIARYNTVENLMRDVPGLVVQRRGIDMVMLLPDGRGGLCVPTMFMDGTAAATGHLFDLTTKEAVALEAYIQPLTVPTAYMQPGGDRKCGAILVWTKYAFKNR